MAFEMRLAMRNTKRLRMKRKQPNRKCLYEMLLTTTTITYSACNSYLHMAWRSHLFPFELSVDAEPMPKTRPPKRVVADARRAHSLLSDFYCYLYGIQPFPTDSGLMLYIVFRFGPFTMPMRRRVKIVNGLTPAPAICMHFSGVHN